MAPIVIYVIRMAPVASSPLVKTHLTDNFATARAFTKCIVLAPVVFSTTRRAKIVKRGIRRFMLDQTLIRVDTEAPAWTLTLEQNFVVKLVPIRVIPLVVHTA